MTSLSRSRNAIQLRLPDEVRQQAAQAAQEEGVSLNQFISLALAERLARAEVERTAAPAPAAAPSATRSVAPNRPQGRRQPW